MLIPIMLILYVAKAAQLNILAVPVVVGALVSGPIALPLFVLFTHKVLLKNSWIPSDRGRARAWAERAHQVTEMVA